MGPYVTDALDCCLLPWKVATTALRGASQAAGEIVEPRRRQSDAAGHLLEEPVAKLALLS